MTKTGDAGPGWWDNAATTHVPAVESRKRASADAMPSVDTALAAVWRVLDALPLEFVLSEHCPMDELLHVTGTLRLVRNLARELESQNLELVSRRDHWMAEACRLADRLRELEARQTDALATPAPAAPVAVPEEVRRAFAEATDSPLYVHDFAHPAVSSAPSCQDINLSFVTPDHITAAFMGDGLTGTIDQARKDAIALAAAWNHCRTLLSAPSATRPEAGEAEDASDVDVILALEQELGVEGVVNVFRASLALAKQAADQARRASPPPVSVSAPTEEGLRETAPFRVGRSVSRNVYCGNEPEFMARSDERASELVTLLNLGLAALSPDTDTAGREGLERVRHVKRGAEYEVLHEGVQLQIAVGTGFSPTGECLHEDDRLVIYRGADGKLWARQEDEFRDGRFECADRPSKAEG